MDGFRFARQPARHKIVPPPSIVSLSSIDIRRLTFRHAFHARVFCSIFVRLFVACAPARPSRRMSVTHPPASYAMRACVRGKRLPLLRTRRDPPVPRAKK